ncbi:MAG: thioredoxin domain-containing protein [Alphaproteobacteria bacterium]|nr:thioredoxin domain-containing protein [Alphaproteobacteria bacterium]
MMFQKTKLAIEHHSKTIVFAVVFLFGVVAGYIIGHNVGARTTVTQGSVTDAIISVRSSDGVYGNLATADIMIIEYSDLQCPFCFRFHNTVKKVVDESKGKVVWLYRQFPIIELHPTAPIGSYISQCVLEHKGQKALWQFINGIFDNFETIPQNETLYRRYAKSLGLSTSQIDACLEKESSARKMVDSNVIEGSAIGVNGTPGGFIVNRKTKKAHALGGAIPEQILLQAITQIRKE